jgi:Cu-Zn family superoxide dismutase
MKTALLMVVLFLVTGCGKKAEPPTGESAKAANLDAAAADSAHAGHADHAAHEAAMAAADSGSAAAVAALTVPFVARSGSKLAGSATFAAQEGGVRVTLQISGVAAGLHGVHVHENPDCSSPDAKSAGPHYNPTKHPHGLPPSDERHLGDLGNISVDQQGNGKLDVLAKGASLEPGKENSFLDRAIIVHEKQDEGAQPDGQAGPRIGCGVIRR